ncbi:hypothetical protein QO179_25135 [Bacillus stercoris]|nr:hypothetical protein [Bacillus stercoris]
MIDFHEFELILVPEYYYTNENSNCPYCDSQNHPENIEMIGSATVNTHGDLMKCVDCNLIYYVVEYPVIPLNQPILTVWRVPRSNKVPFNK